MKIYEVRKVEAKHKPVDIMKVISGTAQPKDFKNGFDRNYTKTLYYEMNCDDRFHQVSIAPFGTVITDENEDNFYTSFQIPKRSGGMRTINSPNSALRRYQNRVLNYMKSKMQNTGRNGGDHHTNAWAYIERRCPRDMMIRHQANQSRFYMKLDFHDFFGSLNMNFCISQLRKIYPWCMYTEATLRSMLRPCFLHNGLPQGAETSPWLSNVVMIPFDSWMSNMLMRKLERMFGGNFVYTRYADDIIISGKYKFSVKYVVDQIEGFLAREWYPLQLNPDKTRFGSRAGHNMNVGIMINKDNEMTVGWKNINKCKVMIFQLIKDHLNGHEWDEHRKNQVRGLINYYKYIQKERINEIIEKYESKYGVKVFDLLKT